MKKNVLPWLMMLSVFASCSSAYKTTQTPDDVYYSPGKTKEYAAVKKEDRDEDDGYADNRSSRRNSSDYDDYTASSDDNYLRMKIQNRYQWNTLDDYDYWYSPNYAYNNYYGFNSFNPYSFNSWGLSYGYSPFSSIQPYSWFNSYYPSYGYGYGYSPYSSGFYGHNYGYGYYGYSPSNVIIVNNRTRTSRPMLGAYTNNNYANSNSNRGNRYVPANGSDSRYNNTNSNSRYYNNSNTNSSRNTFRVNNNTSNSNTYTPPARSYTPSSSGSSSSGGGGSVSRPVRH